MKKDLALASKQLIVGSPYNHFGGLMPIAINRQLSIWTKQPKFGISRCLANNQIQLPIIFLLLVNFALT